MKTKSFFDNWIVGSMALALLAFCGSHAIAQNATDEIELIRSALKADRKVVIAEGMNLTERESAEFWRIYREYRAEMEKIGDARVELVLEYVDRYPEVPEEKAKVMLKKLASLEKKTLDTRSKHLKKLGKVLPAAKVLRFAQLENRLDLALRLQMASIIPLVPAERKTR